MTVDTTEPTQLGELAQIALEGAKEGGDVDQPALVEGPPAGPVVKFVGIKASIDDRVWKNGQRVSISGTGIIIESGGKQLSLKDGTERRVVKVSIEGAVELELAD
jgi:hypothetical protein